VCRFQSGYRFPVVSVAKRYLLSSFFILFSRNSATRLVTPILRFAVFVLPKDILTQSGGIKQCRDERRGNERRIYLPVAALPAESMRGIIDLRGVYMAVFYSKLRGSRGGRLETLNVFSVESNRILNGAL
jgi:hypothetical protein